MARVGVLALQGAFAAHARALARLGHDAVLVRRPPDLDGLEGLVLPGGESTTQLRLLDHLGLVPALERLRLGGVPVLATCAGLILLARRVTGPAQPSLGWLDVDVARNAWGRQLESFEAAADPPRDDLPLVLIRAPRVTAVGEDVEVLAAYAGEPVLVRQGAVTGATFHPELTDRLDVHREVFGAVTPARALA
ncbi:MAG: pyridoxal 5'-phosphate synthase glutaminase subunit PdxT [Planctomycetes bacterium]|nr:pyridoxal 5'-phosphate synthase glutaminase subunit PdxT [Planctomycetota bacterium]